MRRASLMAVMAFCGIVPCISIQAHADPVQFGSWQVATAGDGSYSYAATSNDSGEMFGEFCYYKSGTCLWAIGIHTGCKSGDSYPILANAETGAASLQVQCFGAIGNAGYGLDFSSWKALEASITGSSRIGFAVPLADDQFIVVRFSLDGRIEATSMLEKSFSAAVRRGKETGTSDQVL